MTVPEFDFASAALRHIRHAEQLLASATHGSRDQAWHLAGFAHECARKACVESGWVPKLVGHDFSTASDAVVDVAITLDPRAGRFPVRLWAARYPAISSWRPDHRYERTGTIDLKGERNLSAIVAQGRAAVDDCIVALILDGSLASESLP